MRQLILNQQQANETLPRTAYGLRTSIIFISLALTGVLSIGCTAQTSGPESIQDFTLAYPDKAQTPPAQQGSTHEITFNERGGKVLWITGQNYHQVVQVDMNGKPTFHAMPKGSGPHGIEFDAAGQLWLTLEFHGQIVRLDPKGKIDAQYDVRLDCSTCPQKINTHPHGLGIGSDGKTVWYTGKATGTVGKITPEGRIETFALPTVGSVPIYIKAGPDGNMWVTELVGNKIGHITPKGEVQEFDIPTHNSRPIAIVPEPGGQAMWFTGRSRQQSGPHRHGRHHHGISRAQDTKQRHPWRAGVR